MAVNCSEFLHGFPSLVLASLCTHVTWAQRFSLQLNMCHWNPIYGMVFPYKSAGWTASLTLHLNFHTGSSEQSFDDFLWKISSDIFFLLVLSCKMFAFTTTRSNRWKNFLPPFYCLPFKWITGQHLVWSAHTSFVLVVIQHCSCFYFMMCLPWWCCLNKYIFTAIG
jgi:hypothetical protein